MSRSLPVHSSKRKSAIMLMCDDYVTMTDGTGIVHIAPAFGEDDSKVGRNYDLPFVQLVMNSKGNKVSRPLLYCEADLCRRTADPGSYQGSG